MFPRPVIKNQSSNSPLLRFPQKLWKIANECQTGAVSWSPHGKSILLRYSLFKEEFMSTKSEFFKTDNISSFVRQLNLYGFRKVYDHTDKQAYKANSDLHEFSNLYFQRDKPDLLDKVTRKSGVLKDRNEILNESQSSMDVINESYCEPISKAEYNDENTIIFPPAETTKYQPTKTTVKVEEQLAKPKAVFALSDHVQALSDHVLPLPQIKFIQPNGKTQKDALPATSETQKKKRGRKPGSKRDPYKPRVPRSTKANQKLKKDCLPSLKHPELFPDLIFFDDDDKTLFLRNTSQDVMLSSTLPFQESTEYQDLKDTYHRLYESQNRLRYSTSFGYPSKEKMTSPEVKELLNDLRM